MVGLRQAGPADHHHTPDQTRQQRPAARLRKTPKRWLQDFGWSGLLFESPVFRRIAFINAPWPQP
jgi:hypothetical protein